MITFALSAHKKFRHLRSIIAGALASLLFISSVSAESGNGAGSTTSSWEKLTLPFLTGPEPDKLPGRVFGLSVNPQNGALWVLFSYNLPSRMLKDGGIYTSKDHGDTWSPVTDFPISGRGATAYWTNAAQPFNGKMVWWTIDGTSALTSDAGATWKAIGKQGRGFDCGDVDWSIDPPLTFFALEHEPFYRVLSTDGGVTWKRIDEAGDKESWAKHHEWYPRIGVVNATTLLSTDGLSPGILYSDDLGAKWTRVADFTPLGGHPVHYGKTLYWAASAGIITSENGKEWTLLGSALPNAIVGPIFGASEKDLIVVTDKGVNLSHDGGKTWTQVAPLPQRLWMGKLISISCYFAWDYSNGLLYEAHSGECNRLHLP
jgi:hypothetical protein